MVKNSLTTLAIVFATLIILFFTWHYMLSIYEVRYKYNFNPNKISINKTYCIECVGINALGWELSFRDLYLNCKTLGEIESDKMQLKIDKNKICFQINRIDDFELLFSSKYSLNPTKLVLSAIEKSDED